MVTRGRVGLFHSIGLHGLQRGGRQLGVRAGIHTANTSHDDKSEAGRDKERREREGRMETTNTALACSLAVASQAARGVSQGGSTMTAEDKGQQQQWSTPCRRRWATRPERENTGGRGGGERCWGMGGASEGVRERGTERGAEGERSRGLEGGGGGGRG